MNELKTTLILYTQNFTIYDYMAYGWLFLTFLIFVIFSVIISKKSSIVSILTFFLSLILILVGPFAIKYLIDKSIRSVKVESVTVKKLHFSDTLIVDFSIKNISKMNFKECLVKVKVYKASKNRYKDMFNRLKPIRFKPILYSEKFKKDELMEKRVVFDNFKFNRDINVTIDTDCY